MIDIPKLPENTRLLIMCSSKMRPGRVVDLINSVKENKSEGTELVIYVSEDDPCLLDYKPVLENVYHIIGPNRSMVQVLNFLSTEAYPNVPYYTDLNDDHVVVTKHWDELLIDAIKQRLGDWGMASAWSQTILPTGVVTSRNIIKALGYYYPPNFIHSHVDNIQIEYRNAGMLVDVPEAVIDHRHFIFNKASRDDTYNMMATSSNFNYGLQAFEHWVANQKNIDFNKIQEAKEKEIVNG